MEEKPNSPIVPLTRTAPPQPVPILKALFFVYDFVYGRRIRTMLQMRDTDAVQSLWSHEASPCDFAAAIVKVIETELPWPRGSLIPADSCDMVFKAWQVSPGDCMEGERCLIGFERVMDRRIPASVNLRVQTLGELVDHLHAASTLADDTPRAPALSRMAILLRPIALGLVAGALFGVFTGLLKGVMIYSAIGSIIGLLIGLICVALQLGFKAGVAFTVAWICIWLVVLLKATSEWTLYAAVFGMIGSGWYLAYRTGGIPINRRPE